MPFKQNHRVREHAVFGQKEVLGNYQVPSFERPADVIVTYESVFRTAPQTSQIQKDVSQHRLLMQQKSTNGKFGVNFMDFTPARVKIQWSEFRRKSYGFFKSEIRT